MKYVFVLWSLADLVLAFLQPNDLRMRLYALEAVVLFVGAVVLVAIEKRRRQEDV